MAKSIWKKFPYPDKAYDYAGAALKKAWPDLHRGDCEPFPDEAWVKKTVAAHPKLDPKIPAAKTAEALQAASCLQLGDDHVFLTGDSRYRQVAGLNVALLH